MAVSFHCSQGWVDLNQHDLTHDLNHHILGYQAWFFLLLIFLNIFVPTLFAAVEWSGVESGGDFFLETSRHKNQKNQKKQKIKKIRHDKEKNPRA